MPIYDTLASADILAKTVAALKSHNIDSFIVETKEEALQQVLELIPDTVDISVTTGASRTLEQIGFTEYLKTGNYQWENWQKALAEESDQTKRAALRKQTITADYYLGSAHAVTENGELIIASNTGSQLPNIAFSSPNMIFVVGAQKIVPTLEEGLKRLREYVVPKEDERMRQAFNVGTQLNKILLFLGENPMLGRKVTVILVKEALGF